MRLIRSREGNGWKIEGIYIAQERKTTHILDPWQGNNIYIQTKWN